MRSFVGVESLTAGNLRSLGRSAVKEANQTAMQNLSRRGVLFHFNLLLVHPDSTVGAIEREIESLRGVHGGLLDPFEVEVYEGTDYYRMASTLKEIVRIQHELYSAWREEHGGTLGGGAAGGAEEGGGEEAAAEGDAAAAVAEPVGAAGEAAPAGRPGREASRRASAGRRGR